MRVTVVGQSFLPHCRESSHSITRACSIDNHKHQKNSFHFRVIDPWNHPSNHARWWNDAEKHSSCQRSFSLAKTSLPSYFDSRCSRVPRVSMSDWSKLTHGRVSSQATYQNQTSNDSFPSLSKTTSDNGLNLDYGLLCSVATKTKSWMFISYPQVQRSR